jgi:hypothetical protein
MFNQNKIPNVQSEYDTKCSIRIRYQMFNQNKIPNVQSEYDTKCSIRIRYQMFNQNTQIEGLKTQLQRKRTNYLQNTTQKIKDRATRTQPKIGGGHGCSGRVGSS